MKKSLFRKSIVTILINALLVVSIGGCAGHAANPVDRYQPGDEKKSCNALYSEMAACDDEIVVKNSKKTGRDAWNVLCIVGGLFVIVPFFFMDINSSYECEIAALKARKTQLMTYFADKDCSAPQSKIALR